MHWLALLPCPPSSAEAAAANLAVDDRAALARQHEAQLQALAWLALRFSPRVARLEEAVVLEVEASLRLFRGARALDRRLKAEAAGAGLALQQVSWAPTSLGALALARAGVANGLRGRLAAQLDALPLAALSAVGAHHAMLARLGCRGLADVRRLPRPALARRFGPEPLRALDEAYGELPEVHRWIAAPEQFAARLELPFRVEHAPALLHYVQVLLRQLCGWLAARHAGIKELRLDWQHDAMRARDSGAGGSLRIATAETSRDFGHLSRLFSEHLAQTRLAAPAGELRLHAETVLPLAEASASLLPPAPGDQREQAREPLHQLLERLAVRLGPEQVRGGRLCADHRLDRMQRWERWPLTDRPAAVGRSAMPQPTWLVEPPLRLTAQRDRPQYQGPLQQIAGPHRVEAGWWDTGAAQQRDYFLFHSATAGLLWIYTERLSAHEQGWFLHGIHA